MGDYLEKKQKKPNRFSDDMVIVVINECLTDFHRRDFNACLVRIPVMINQKFRHRLTFIIVRHFFSHLIEIHLFSQQ